MTQKIHLKIIPKCLLAHILFNYLSYHDIKNCVLTDRIFNVFNDYQKEQLLNIYNNFCDSEDSASPYYFYDCDSDGW